MNVTSCACMQTLSEPFYTDRKGEIPEGKKGYYAMPIVHCHNGLVTINYGGEFIQVCHDMRCMTDLQSCNPSKQVAFVHTITGGCVVSCTPRLFGV